METPINKIILISILLLALSACSLGPQETGILEGQVTIGPLMPAVQVGKPEPTPAPEVYAAREIVVYQKNGKIEVTRLSIGTDGFYRAELPVGVYVIDINRLGIDSADNLPLEISIQANSTYTLDIDIDTGIR